MTLDRSQHEITMRNIVEQIYSNKILSPLLGFKGGTACYFFYGLPRFSTDLDFNLLDLEQKKVVFQAMENLLSEHGEIKDKIIKRNTIFFLVSHTPKRSAIKVEISTRKIEEVNSYHLLEFYGTSVLVIKKADLFANKLIALKHRSSPTPRDLYDVNFFFRKKWNVAEEIIYKVTGKTLQKYLEELIPFIKQNFNQTTILQGIGQLLEGEKEKDFVKTKLIDDTIKRIKIYLDSQGG